MKKYISESNIYQQIVDYDTEQYIEDIKELNNEDYETINNLTDFYGRFNMHRQEFSVLRDNIMRDVIHKNRKEKPAVLVSTYLSLLFFDTRWLEMTRDMSTAKRALAFNTTEENVIKYDILEDHMKKVLDSNKQKVKSL